MSSLLNYDIFGYPLQINYKNNNKQGTLLGFIFTIITISICITLFVVQLISLLKKEKPMIISQSPFILNPSLQLINIQEQPIMFSIADLLGNAINNQNFFNYQFLQCTGYKCITIEAEKCEIGTHIKGQYISLVENINMTNIFCVSQQYSSTNMIQLQGSSNNPANQQTNFQIKVRSCINTTENNNQCSESSLINNFNGVFNLYSFDSYQNLNSQGQSSIPFVKKYSTSFSPQTKKVIKYNYKIAQVDTDNGLFLEDINTDLQLQFSDAQEILSNNNNQMNSAVYFSLSQIQLINSRRYQKMQDLIGNIGGIFSILYSVLFIILKPIQRFIFQFKLAQEFIIIKESKSEQQIENEILDTQNSKLRLRLKDYLYYFGIGKDSKFKKIQLTVSLIEKYQDFSYIFKKMNQIDNLLKIIFDPTQIAMFKQLEKLEINLDLTNLNSLQAFKEFEIEQLVQFSNTNALKNIINSKLQTTNDVDKQVKGMELLKQNQLDKSFSNQISEFDQSPNHSKMNEKKISISNTFWQKKQLKK